MDIMHFVKNNFGIDFVTQNKIYISLIIIFCLFLLKKIIQWFVFKKVKTTESRYFLGKTFIYLQVGITLLLLIKVWFKGIKPIATYLGLLSAGIAIALKDIFTDIVGWIFILLKKPFSVGDRIQIDIHKGDVIDIRLFQFSIVEVEGEWIGGEQSTGRIINIPNSYIFTKPLANYTKGFSFIWNEISVLITFESNWEKAKKILLKTANEITVGVEEKAKKELKKASFKYYINYNVLSPTVYTKIEDSGILLTVRYLCNPRMKRITENEFWEKILKEFNINKDMDFAYPTIRYYNNTIEGKNK